MAIGGRPGPSSAADGRACPAVICPATAPRWRLAAGPAPWRPADERGPETRLFTRPPTRLLHPWQHADTIASMATQEKKLLTTTDLATAKGCDPVTVIRAAQRLGYERTGRDWIFTPEQAAKILDMAGTERGNPNFGKKIPAKKTAKRGKKRGS